MPLPTSPQVPGQIIDHYDRLDAHLAAHFAPEEITYFEEQQTLGFTLDVFRIRPAGADYQILLTSGMSTLPMPIPPTIHDPLRYRFAELCMVLPANWQFSTVVPSHPDRDWPVAALKHLARLPFREQGFLTEGHTVLHDAHYQSYAPSVDFVGAVLVRPVTRPEVFTRITSPKGPIHFWSVFPLYQSELFFIHQRGWPAFKALLQVNEVYEMVHPDRICLVE